jgi:hypothetical protein
MDEINRLENMLKLISEGAKTKITINVNDQEMLIDGKSRDIECLVIKVIKNQILFLSDHVDLLTKEE